MANHPEWVRTRKKMLSAIKAHVALLQGPTPKDISSYTSEYKREFNGKWQPTSQRQLIDEILASDIVIGGDFHAFLQAQKTHYRLIRRLPQSRPMVLCLECFEQKDQDLIDAYVSGVVSEQYFLNEVDWNNRWGFPWEHYRRFVDLAREKNIRLIGINKFMRQRNKRALHQRDIYAASVIADYRRKLPDHLFYVIFGDLHLAKQHLPKRIRSVLPKARVTTLFQNSQKLYFKLAEQGLEKNIEILSGTGGRFCVLNSPPWVKWQSYLMYLEHTFDRDLEDEEEAIDYTDHIHSLVQVIAKDLNIPADTSRLEVYSAEQPNFLSIINNELKAADLKIASHLMAVDRSFPLPQQSYLYLSRATINHAAHLAGQYLHSQLCGLHRNLWDLPKDFEALIWHEAVGFFSSKLINHRRKAENIRDLKAQLEMMRPRDKGKEFLLLALDQRLSEVLTLQTGRFRPRKTKVKQPISYIEAARVLGSMLGERMFNALHTKRMNREKVVRLLKMPIKENDFSEDYLSIVKQMESQVPDTTEWIETLSNG